MLSKNPKIHDTDPLLVEMPMPIITPRLLIRPAQSGDGQALAEAKQASWPELQKWMEWANDDTQLTEEKSEIFCRQKQADFILRQDIHLNVFDHAQSRIVASTGLHDIDWKGRVFHTGYWVRSDETGKGYATELTNAMIRYAFGALAANRVYIGHFEGNEASQRVIEKLGFEKEGVTKNSSVLNGELMTSVHYGRYDADNLPDLDVRWE